MLDSYEIFFNKGYITKEEFFDFGIKETIYIEHSKAKDYWIKLKRDVIEGNEVYIRGYGRNAWGTQLFQNLYSNILGNEKVFEDSTNNSKPEKVLSKTTNFRKNIKQDSKEFIKIQNYQVSHVFGKTKNPFLFQAPWNIVYIPKIIDPFTGHEARGKFAEEFSNIFKNNTFEKYQDLIEDYNKLIAQLELIPKIEDYFKRIDIEGALTKDKFLKFKDDVLNEFSEIRV